MVVQARNTSCYASCRSDTPISFLSLLFSLSLILQFAMVDAQSLNVVTEVKRALEGIKELSSVYQYLTLAEKDILPTLSGSQTGYTFFAPTNWAFVRMMPQDIADPFYVDTELRTTVLLHHFVRQKLSADDLLKTTELMMADKKPSTLTRSSSPNGVQINKAKVNLDPIHFGSNTGVIYIVDKVFTTHEEISKAIERNPASETPWGPIHPQSNPANNGDNVESQTVVVDLVAELLRDEATGQH